MEISEIVNESNDGNCFYANHKFISKEDYCKCNLNEEINNCTYKRTTEIKGIFCNVNGIFPEIRKDLIRMEKGVVTMEDLD